MFEKSRKHISDHKFAYISGGVGLVVGASIATLIVKRPTTVVAKNQLVGLVNWKNHQNLEVYIEALGDPGNIIQEVTDGVRGRVYASQGQLARDLGVNPARISEHFSGKLPNIHGRTFEKLGKACVS